MTLLSVSGVSARLGGVQILDSISFDIAPGEFVGLLGPNGAGKSTLLRAVMGLIRAEGSVRLAGRDAPALSPRERAATVAYLPQEREIAWAVPVEMLVSLGRSPYRPRFGPLGAEDRAAIDRAMQRMDVARLRERSASALSGGELARVLTARALAQETPLLLADEPTAGLDPAHQIALMRIFTELAREGRAIMASLHDLGLASRWCTRLVILNDGVIAADGTPREVLTERVLAEVYGIRAYLGTAEGGPVVQILDRTDRGGETV